MIMSTARSVSGARLPRAAAPDDAATRSSFRRGEKTSVAVFEPRPTSRVSLANFRRCERSPLAAVVVRGSVELGRGLDGEGGGESADTSGKAPAYYGPQKRLLWAPL